jgi:uncharacterized protein
MQVTRYDDANDFLRAAGAWLEQRESVNNLMLGLAARLAGGWRPVDAPAVMATAGGPSGPAAALLMTPPRAGILYAEGPRAQEPLDALVQSLRAAGQAVPGCLGPSPVAEAFARTWCRESGERPSLKMAQRIHELRQVRSPGAADGAPRLPRADDLDLLAEWWYAFGVEAMGEGERAAARESAERMIAAGQTLLWEDQGRPVSMASAVRPTRKGIAVGGVYTPSEHRRRGYASACVAKLSQRQLDAGREFCCLYTDLANPTSNHIYRTIGYAPVADSSYYRFDPA